MPDTSIQDLLAERDRLAAALHESEERIRLIADGVKDYAIFMLDAEGCVATWNSGAQRIMGYAEAEILGRSVSIFYRPEDIAVRKPQRDLARAIQSGSYTEECWRVRKDGSRFIACATITALRDRVLRFARITRDMTEREKAAQALKESEEWLRMANAAAGVGVFAGDLVAGKWRLSPELLALFGAAYDAQSSCRNPLDFVHRDDRDQVIAAIARAEDPNGDGLFQAEHRVTWPDASVRWIAVKGRTEFAPTPSGRKPIAAVGACVDITERKRVENDLKTLTDRFERAVEGANDGLWEWDRTTMEVWTSPRFWKLLGFAADAQLPADAYADWTNRLHPEDAEETLKAVTLHVESGAPYDREYRLRTESGEYRWFGARGVSQRDSAGKAIRMAGSLRDIHSRVTARQELKTLADRFAAATEGANDGLWDWSVGSDMVWRSARFWTLLGFPPDAEFPPNTLASFHERLHPDDAPATIAARAAHLETGVPFNIEFRLRTFSGEYRWFRSRAALQRDEKGKPLRMAGSIQDIHEMKQLEAARARSAELLAASNAALEEAQALGRLGSWSIDFDTGKIEWSRQLYRLHGREESLGPREGDASIAAYVEQDAGRIVAAVNKAREDGAPYNIVLQLREPVNGMRFVRARGKVQRNESGRIVGMFGTTADVTAEVEREEALKAARQQAEAANRSKSEFLANMSHEIRTPLTSIIGFTDLLSAPACTPDERAEFIQTIRRNGQHLLRVLNDLLDLSKIEAGKMTVECVACSPANIIAEIDSIMRVQAIDKNISFAIEYGGRIPHAICTDPTRLRQILLNLVSNAVKFTETGGVRLSIRTEMIGSAPRLRFDVADTGIGISAEQQADLFLPFRQGDPSTTRRFGGTGLGLAISKRLAAMLGGDLSVTSEVGRGSVFTLVIDAVETEIRKSEVRGSVGRALPGVERTGGQKSEVSVHRYDAASPFPSQPLHGRILLAEDGGDNRRLITACLQQAGLFVETAPDGQAAVARVIEAAEQGRPYDLVLMDMHMPRLDGYDATRELRRRGFGDLPIIALTAHALAGERERCIECGCDDYAPKPIDLPALLAMLRQHLGRVAASSGGNEKSPCECASQESICSDRIAEPVMQKILVEYLSELPARVDHMLESLKQGDLAAVRQLAHQLKGSGKSYGFPDISRLAAALEDTIIRGQPHDRVRAGAEALAALLRRVEGYDRSKER
jgi:PAS domain S-box-containing protein